MSRLKGTHGTKRMRLLPLRGCTWLQDTDCMGHPPLASRSICTFVPWSTASHIAHAAETQTRHWRQDFDPGSQKHELLLLLSDGEDEFNDECAGHILMHARAPGNSATVPLGQTVQLFPPTHWTAHLLLANEGLMREQESSRGLDFTKIKLACWIDNPQPRCGIAPVP